MPGSLPFRPAESLRLVRENDTVPPVMRVARDWKRGGVAVTPPSDTASVAWTVSSTLFRFAKECAGGAVQDKMASLWSGEREAAVWLGESEWRSRVRGK